MASFAKIGLNNKVIAVHSVHNNVLKDADGNEQEVLGVEFLTNLHGWAIWKQTSYNTYGGVHKSGGTPLRKNFAGKGYTYDEDRNAFIPPNTRKGWLLNEQTCLWESPIPRPEDGKKYTWNNDLLNWVVIDN
jgi:hypothetical protein